MTLVLGIETSCDETAAAVVEDGRRVRSNVVASQHELHERYAGVVPEIASRAHVERILPVVEQAVEEAGIELDDVDAVSVGNRPGLIGSLLVGVSAAQALAWTLDKPLIGIDHVRAHLYAAFLHEGEAEAVTPEYPLLGLVVSGGHTSLYLVESPSRLSLLGHTIDDAAGEAFDKAAVILGLGYPGGPAIDRAAKDGNPRAHQLPRSLLEPASLDFSFSGLKTALLYLVRGKPRGRGANTVFDRSAEDLSDAQRADVAASFQAAAVDALILKIERAVDQLAEKRRPVRGIVIGGGVSANSHLRSRVAELSSARGLPVHVPAMAYCVDNAAMIAGLADHALREERHDPLDLPALATGSL